MTKLAFVLESGREVSVPLTENLPLGQLAEMTAALSDLRNTHQEAEAALARTQSHLDQRKAEVVSTTESLANAKMELAKAKEAQTRAEDLVMNAEKTLSTTAGLIESANQTVDKLDQNIAKRESEIRALSDSKSAAECQLAVVQTEIESLNRMRDDKNAVVKQLSEDKAKLDEQLEELNRQVAEREQRLDEVQAETTRVRDEHLAEKDRIEEQVRASTQELEDLIARMAPLRDWKTSMDSRLTALSEVPEDSLEARNIRNDIDMAMAALRHVLSAPANRLGNLSTPALERLGIGGGDA